MLLDRLTTLYRNNLAILLAGMMSILLMPSQAVFAADFEIEAINQKLSDIESLLKRERYDEKKLKEFTNQITEIKSGATTCVTDFVAQQTDTQAILASLGEPAPKEPLDVTRKRRDIQKQLTDIEKQLGSCRVVVIRSEELQDKINEATKLSLIHI